MSDSIVWDFYKAYGDFLDIASKLNQLDYKEKMNGEEIQEAGYANAAMAIINTKERLTLDS